MAGNKTRDILAHPSPGEEVVISGISGYFPKCDSVMELQEKLFNKEDLISDKTFGETLFDVPGRMGKINKINKFDGSFFGVSYLDGYSQNPEARLLLERAYEAIIDAGVNPVELRNTKTGVYIGVGFIDSETTLMYDQLQTNNNGIVGCSRGMLATQISKWLKVTGPSYTLDAACSSSLFALEQAYKDVREGRCDTAIVGGASLSLNPGISYHLIQLGVLSVDGKCKSFDNSGNGYVRSEAITTCILQRAKDARRVYAQIVHSKTNCDGFTEQGITYPAAKLQRRLLEEVYEECATSPQDVEFMECHGTGTRVGDPQELAAIDAVLCPGRTEPLLIGSVKSNLGHTEPDAGLTSLAKLCIAYNSGYIPPNINFRKYREGVPAFAEGRLRVVTEKTPWNRGLTAINNLGFGGANAHVLFKNIARDKINNGIPKDDLPRLVCVSGRTHSAVARILSSLADKPVDVEEVRLWHSIHEHNIEGHGYRGYILLGSGSQRNTYKEIRRVSELNPKVCFVYSNEEIQWNTAIPQLMKIPIFADTIHKCHQVLRPKGIDLISFINTGCFETNSISSIVMLTAFQIGVTNVLSAVGIKPDFIIGCGAGEIACAYADDCLTLEQTILVAYYSGIAVIDANYVEHTCNGNEKINTPNVFESILSILIEKGKGTDQLSSRIANNGLKLLASLKDVISSLNNHSKRWLSSTTNNDRRTLSKSGTSLAEYYDKINLKPETRSMYQTIPTDSIILEIAPRIVVKDMTNKNNSVSYVVLGNDNNTDELNPVFRALGELFQVGLNPHLANLYPYVSYPVSQGTPMLSHLVEWYHEENWFTDFTVDNIQKSPSIERTVKISLEDDKYLNGYIVDGDNLYPGSGYLVLVWETLSLMMQKSYKELPVVFEDICFVRNIVIPKTEHLEIIITIHRISGNFEISERGLTVATGRVYALNNNSDSLNEINEREAETCDRNTPCMKSEDVYKLFRLRGFEYSGEFQGIKECNVEGTYFKIAWINNWVAFLDNIIQSFIITSEAKNILLHTRIKKLSIDTKKHYYALQDLTAPKIITAHGHKYSNSIRSTGIVMSGVHCTAIIKKQNDFTPVLGKHVFVPLEKKSLTMMEDALRATIQLIIENLQAYTIKVLEIIDEEYEIKSYNAFIQNVSNILQDQPFINFELGAVINSDGKTKMPPSILINDKIEVFKNITFIIAAELCERTDGQWGTYRHLKLKSLDQTVPVHHAYNNIETIGDLSTLKWYEGPLDKNTQIGPQMLMVHVYCAALNFRDVMTATGRVAVDAVCRSRIDQECVQGLEVVGRTANGTRVMGMVEKGISNMALCHKNFIMAIPDEWSFEEAATVFVAYSTVYLALVVFGKIKPGESVLIHAGTGGVGQAAIHVALSYGCEVFTTVSSDEKRAFIKKLFPQIKDTHIGYSRDSSFEEMIQRETKGKGVDVALNSLADEMLQATARCLAHGGRFLEIGKSDILKNTLIEMDLHQKEVSFHGVMLEFLYEEKCSSVRKRLLELLISGIASGAVRPLTYCKFGKDEVEAAFRYMASGKHIGKVIIKLRDEEPRGTRSIPKLLKIDAVKSYTCASDKVYILVGGLGGFGLELADWLILRGARKLVLVSRNGVTNGYQAYKLSLWKSYGSNIKISTHDVMNENGFKSMLKMANAMGQVVAVFNLAVVINDMILPHQNSRTFMDVYAPKASVTFNLDKLTRELCPTLKDFVIFSSVSCGHGNAGQTNYGFANSVMERICEKRKKDGLPALAIQFGPIGDVGFLKEKLGDSNNITTDLVPQRIHSCLRTLDKFLKQDEVVVSSFIPVEKKAERKERKTAVDIVAKIMGIKNLKTVSYQRPLADLGMDSIVAMEIKLALERNFEIFLSAQETRNLTFAKLTKLSNNDANLSKITNSE